MADGDQGERDQAKPGDQTAGVDLGAAIAGGDLDQAMAELAQLLPAGAGDEPGLPLGDDAGDDADLIAKAAETVGAKRRARGRPPGAANKRNDELFDYLEAVGFKNPARRLMEIISADPRDLAKALAGPLAAEPTYERALDVMREQVKASAALLPYLLAKKPQQLDIVRQNLHVFLAGRLGGDASLADKFDVMQPLDQIEQNQSLSSDAPAKSDGESRTDGGKPSDAKALDPS